MAGLAITALSPSSSVAAAQTVDTQPRTIQVSGNGEINAQPDRASVQLGVQTEAESAQDALQLNSKQMNAVIEALLEAGIEESDIQTQVLRLSPIYNSADEPAARTLTGYRASNMVKVMVRDLNTLGDLLDTAVTAGGNSLDGIQFELSNQAELETAAREAAMRDAQQKAEQLAELAGVELTAVQKCHNLTLAPPTRSAGQKARPACGCGDPVYVKYA